MTVAGTFYSIGVGPGDPELLTLKAVRLIQSDSIITYPIGGSSGKSLAREIALPHIPESAEQYGFDIPMCIERAPAFDAYNKAAVDITGFLEKGRNVLFLCEGDPLFYGSAMYLVERLSQHFTCEVVPGITSLTACAAATLRPLAARNERLKVMPAPLPDQVLEEELSTTEAAAIIKVGRHFERIRNLLHKLGLDEEAVIVERATSEGEKITLLKDLPEGERPYFSTILIYAGKERWGESSGE